MLCNGCGKEIGEKPGLCPSCAAQAARLQHSALSGGPGGEAVQSGALGRITPLQKIVHLKPGDIRPDGSVVPGGPASASATGEHRSTPRGSAHVPTTQPRRRRKRVLVGLFAGLLLFAGGLAAAYLAEQGRLTLPEGFTTIFEKEDRSVHPLPVQVGVERQPSLSSQEAVGPPPIGTLDFDGLTHHFVGSTATWSPSKSTLEVSFIYHPRPAGVEPKSPRREGFANSDPNLHFSFLFEKGTQKLSVDKLVYYAVEFIFNGTTVRLPKTYSKRLASFGEISSAGGTFANGETVRGELRDIRTTPFRGAQTQVDWALKFEAPIQVVP